MNVVPNIRQKVKQIIDFKLWDANQLACNTNTPPASCMVIWANKLTVATVMDV